MFFFKQKNPFARKNEQIRFYCAFNSLERIFARNPVHDSNDFDFKLYWIFQVFSSFVLETERFTILQHYWRILFAMADCTIRRVGQRRRKIRNVPVAITHEGFWCCPSPNVFQKTLKSQQISHKGQNSSPPPSKVAAHKTQNHQQNGKLIPNSLRSMLVNDDHMSLNFDSTGLSPPAATERVTKPGLENSQPKVVPEFGDPETSDLLVVLWGKKGFSVNMRVHRDVLVEQSSLFADKLSRQSPVSCIEIRNCEDLDIYVETLGLMYCEKIKQSLMKHNVTHVLRILKVGEILGFHACIQSCLEYLDAVPWVEEEEEKVVSSVLRLGSNFTGVVPLLRRVSSEITDSSNDTLVHIIQLVLKSNDERGRREMQSLVLRLLGESNLCNRGIRDGFSKHVYNSCQSCLDALLALFRQASEHESMDGKGPVARRIALEADNLLWLVDILGDRHVAEGFVGMWASQHELAMLHSRLPIVSRHIVSCITARLFVGIGRGDILPTKDTRKLLIQTWLQPLIDDYCWLRHGCRSFDGKMVEEGIGRTVLTLPLEDQQSILLAWFDSFLKCGSNCPNLQKAFETWWRRAFVRAFVEKQGCQLKSDNAMSAT